MKRPAFFALFLALALGACRSETAPADPGAPEPSAEAAGPLVIYTGRRDVLVGPLVERFQRETGLRVDVRYGTDAEMLAALAEEGGASRASLFWANTAGALGTAAARGLLVELPDTLRALPTSFVPSSGRWLPVTTRFRVLAYNPQRVAQAALPSSVMALPQASALSGRIGWTPTYSSFQDFITAMRQTQGEAETQAWLRGMQALRPNAYPSNGPMIEALMAGEIDVALTNHYYVLRALYGGQAAAPGSPAEAPANAPPAAAVADARAALHTFADGDVGNLALVTGAGVLANAPNPAAARRFLAYLLSAPAQAFAAEEVFEYPVVEGSTLPPYFVPLDRARALSPALDFEALGDLEATLRMLREAGLL